VLWPILHYRLDLAEFARRDLSGSFRDQLVQQRAKQRNTTSITAASAPEESTFQTVDQANEPERAAAIVWPDPPTPAMATAQSPIATPIAAPIEATPTESVQPPSVARATGDYAQDSAQAGAPTNSAGGAKALVVSEPVEISPQLFFEVLDGHSVDNRVIVANHRQRTGQRAFGHRVAERRIASVIRGGHHVNS
jgi:hypothetical protein